MKLGLMLVVVAYLAVTAYLYFFQRGHIYFPGLTRPAALESNFEMRHDGVTLKGWQMHPERQAAIIYFGGNAERIEYNVPDFEALFPNHAVYLLAYRGYGDSGGTPTEAALIADALALYDQVAGGHGAVSLIGRSLGSGVAVAVAAQRPARRLVLVTPFDSLAAVAARAYPLFPVRLMLKDRYASVELAPAVQAHTLILYAEHDGIIPTDSVRRLAAGFTAAAVETVEIQGADHNDISRHPAYRSNIAAFLK